MKIINFILEAIKTVFAIWLVMTLVSIGVIWEFLSWLGRKNEEI